MSGTAAVLRAGREAVVTMLAVVATSLCALALDPTPASAVAAVVLCVALARSQLDLDRRGRIEAAIFLPLVALVAAAEGALLQSMPWIGASVFVAGMAFSIWARRFGPMASRIGSLIALPFVTLLCTPHVAAPRATSLPAAMVPVVVAWFALFWVGALHALARRAGFLPPARSALPPATAAVSAVSLRPMASTRMAIQMAAALALAFVVGYAFFPERWAWVVLTAFIVNSANRGRLDVAYKSVLRVLGAAGGTVVALSLGAHVGSHDAATAALILLAVFLGVWLRPLGYAWWALFVTIALALLQGFGGSPAQGLLWPRLEEIAIGALIGVACAWFVLPVKSVAVLRRRLADALAALSDALDPAAPERSPRGFEEAVARVEQMRPAFHALRLATRGLQPLQPADWVDALLACRAAATACIGEGGTQGSVRRAVGAARRSMSQPEEILPALQALQRTLAAPR